MLPDELLLVQTKINGRIRWRWWRSHCCSAQLLPERVAKLESTATHDDAKPFDDGIVGQVFTNVVLVAAQESSDFVESVLGWDACVHGYSIGGEQLGVGWKVEREQFLLEVFTALEVAFKHWKKMLQLAVDPDS